MARSRFAFILSVCSLVAALVSSTIAQASAALDRFGRFVLDSIAPAGGYGLPLSGSIAAPLSIDGIALSRSTQHGLRHEAGTGRRAAPRNI